jgi:3-hydroxymyristoyl/3-hydroxydecanoyl-(acyl carrier protein) dehydratase
MPDAAFVMPADHPCLAGHFPGRPVVPGVALLDALAVHLGPLAALDGVRFLAPVLPGEDVALAWSPDAAGWVAFTGHAGGRLAFRGRARVRA